MPLLDIKGEEVHIGDKVLVAYNKRDLRLGVFERVSKVSFVIRVQGSAFSVPLKFYVNNPAWDWNTYGQLGSAYNIPTRLEVENDKPNSSIIKVDKEFSL